MQPFTFKKPQLWLSQKSFTYVVYGVNIICLAFSFPIFLATFDDSKMPAGPLISVKHLVSIITLLLFLMCVSVIILKVLTDVEKLQRRSDEYTSHTVVTLFTNIMAGIFMAYVQYAPKVGSLSNGFLYLFVMVPFLFNFIVGIGHAVARAHTQHFMHPEHPSRKRGKVKALTIITFIALGIVLTVACCALGLMVNKSVGRGMKIPSRTMKMSYILATSNLLVWVAATVTYGIIEFRPTPPLPSEKEDHRYDNEYKEYARLCAGHALALTWATYGMHVLLGFALASWSGSEPVTMDVTVVVVLGVGGAALLRSFEELHMHDGENASDAAEAGWFQVTPEDSTQAQASPDQQAEAPAVTSAGVVQNAHVGRFRSMKL